MPERAKQQVVALGQLHPSSGTLSIPGLFPTFVAAMCDCVGLFSPDLFSATRNRALFKSQCGRDRAFCDARRQSGADKKSLLLAVQPCIGVFVVSSTRTRCRTQDILSTNIP